MGWGGENMDYREFDENFSLEGKRALITGAASGIGLEISKMYARKGADIIAFDLTEAAELKKYVESQGRSFMICQGDITKIEDIQNAVDLAIAEYGKIDILVNCAGVGLIDKAEDLSEDIWDKTMSINLKGSFRMTQVVGRTMLKNGGGKIICIASQAGIVALEKHVAYGCSKAAIIQMVKQFALEWARNNINVNAISPTVILTPLGERVWNNPTGDAFKQTIPARRFGYPEEVAACTVFLASDAARLINGANLVIDGGFTIA
jgi:glycerol dehydrogenase